MEKKLIKFLKDNGFEYADENNMGQKIFTKGSIEIVIEVSEGTQACRVCGCTQERACPGGCFWAEVNLCSECVRKGEKKNEQK